MLKATIQRIFLFFAILLAAACASTRPGLYITDEEQNQIVTITVGKFFKYGLPPDKEECDLLGRFDRAEHGGWDYHPNKTLRAPEIVNDASPWRFWAWQGTPQRVNIDAAIQLEHAWPGKFEDITERPEKIYGIYLIFACGRPAPEQSTWFPGGGGAPRSTGRGYRISHY